MDIKEVNNHLTNVKVVGVDVKEDIQEDVKEGIMVKEVMDVHRYQITIMLLTAKMKEITTKTMKAEEHKFIKGQGILFASKMTTYLSEPSLLIGVQKLLLKEITLLTSEETITQISIGQRLLHPPL